MAVAGFHRSPNTSARLWTGTNSSNIPGSSRFSKLTPGPETRPASPESAALLMPFDLRAVARQFQLYGDFVSAEPYGSGHINDTFCVVLDQAGTRVRYILQRLNPNVFQDPVGLMT